MYVGMGDLTPEQFLATMPGYGLPCVMSGAGWQQGCAASGPNAPDRFNLICAEFYGPNCVAAAPSWEYPSSEWPQPQAAGVDAGVPCQASAFGNTPCNPSPTSIPAPAALVPLVASASSATLPGAAASVSAAASGMSTTTLLILAALGIGVVLWMGN